MIRKRLLRLSAPLAISGASVTIYSIVDKLMLGYFNGADEVGLYSIARNLHETTLFPTFALVMMLRPALAEAWSRGDMKRFTDLVNRSVLDSLHYSLLVVVVFACLASPIITGLFTDKFESSTGIMLLFLPIIALRGIGSVVLPGLVAADRADTYARLTLAGAVLNFALNMLMIPVWGANGAVISTLISYLPIEVFGLRSLYRMAPGFWGRRDWIKAAKSLVSAAATVLLYLLIAPAPGNIVETILHAAVVSCLFSGLLLLSRAITVKELLELARPLIKRR
jgi:O-antigen/teichoic acid export membrane protein